MYVFYKMHGSGNDFVLFDNRQAQVPVDKMSEWAAKLCPRAFGIGADGCIFLESAPEGSDLAFIWHFYNADGSRAEMCGNASRCATKLAVELGFAGPELTFGTDAGPIQGTVLDGGHVVKVQLTQPKDIQLSFPLEVDGRSVTAHFADTGVPHTVIFQDSLNVPDIDALDIPKLGAAVRYHEHFAPRGTNANFAQITDRSHIRLRTYERGVEAETYACGTGAAATALVANSLGLTDNEVTLTTSGGETLAISLENGVVYLTGKAIKVYTGELDPASVGLGS